jgi:hypothetical protein
MLVDGVVAEPRRTRGRGIYSDCRCYVLRQRCLGRCRWHVCGQVHVALALQAGACGK